MENTKKASHTKTLNMVLCAMFAALIAAGAFIRIPIPYVPLSLQLFFVTLSGLLLGAKRGSVSALVYMITGLIGIPIFTEGGGIGYIFKTTFGYIIGFVIGAYITGKIARSVAEPSYKRLIIASLAGVAAVYVCGMVYCYAISNLYLGTGMTVKSVFLYCFLFIIPGDLVCSVLASILAKKLIPILDKMM